MFLCHARSPVPVVQENLKTFNFEQVTGASIWPEDSHLAVNQIVRVAMFLCHAMSPVPVVQENIKTFNFGCEPDCESYHFSMTYKVTSTSISGQP